MNVQDIQNVSTYNKRIAAQVGAGLSFPLSALLFLASGRWLIFALIPAGALLGLAVAALGARYPWLYEGPARLRSAARPVAVAVLCRFQDERLAIRLVLLLVLATVLFVGTWSTAYAFLPERILAGNNPLMAPVTETVAPTLFAEWRMIVAVNLLPLAGIALLNLILGYPYAALLPLAWVVYYALLLGTNSFALPMAAPMAPSLAVLERAGPYEMGAYLFAAAATYPLSQISPPWRKVGKGERQPIPWGRILAGLLLSTLVIMLAGWREAAMIFAR